jgi:hypothetical protein
MFTAKWVERFDEISPVSIEAYNRQTLDEIFDRCKVRLFGMRLNNGGSLLDGFIIFGEDGVERRRWFELSPTHEAAIISGMRQRLGRYGFGRECFLQRVDLFIERGHSAGTIGDTPDKSYDESTVAA